MHAGDKQADYAPSGAVSLDVLAGQARLLFRHSLVGIAAALFVALLQTGILWEVAERNRLLWWIGSMVAVTLLRLGIIGAYQRFQGDRRKLETWVSLVVLGNLLSGILWGSSVLLFQPDWPMQPQVTTVLALTGVTAGAISAYAVIYRALMAIQIPALLPFIVWFLAQPDPTYRSLGVMILIYAVGMSIIGRTHHHAVRRSLQLGVDNQQLVHQLRASNRQLEQEVRDRQRAMEILAEQKERMQVTLHSIGDGVITTDPRDRVLYLNAVAEQLTGWSSDAARGRPVGEVLSLEDDPAERRPLLERRGSDLHEVIGRQHLRRRDGAHFYINSSRAPIRSRDGHALGSVIVFHDVTEQRKMAERLSYQATHDALTGLINRREFERYVELALQSAKRDGEIHCVCYLDLDQFKIVNDTSGHIAGDELLRRLSTGLPGLLRDTDVFARLGGDEFGVLLEGCTAIEAQETAERIRSYIREHRFMWDGKVFEVGVSIGLVEVTRDSHDVAGILSAADIACYAAKELGRNRVHVYQTADSESGRRHSEIQLVSDITRAVEEDRLVLYFQKIAPVEADETAGLHGEILVRMLDDEGELVTPGLFLPAAERYNLMPTVDLWVVRSTLRWWAEYCPTGGAERNGLVAINLSGNSVGSESFHDQLLAVIDEFSEVAHTLCFEITETAAISNFETATGFINRLRTYGVKIALDDFGSGLSSFAYLKNLPVDYLKIDGSFVRDIVDDPIDREMVKSIHQLGRVMGIQTIAEFVENDRILAQLREIGVDFAQGYGISRPVPLADVLDHEDAGRSARPA